MTKEQQFKITVFNFSAYQNASLSIKDCYRVREFVRQLQTSVANDDRKNVAGMLKYPLYYHGEQKTVTLHSAQETLRSYDLIFSSKLRRAISEQKVWDLMSQSDGVAIGAGFVWINKPSPNGPFDIISIFEPY